MWNYDLEDIQTKLYEYFFDWPEDSKTRKKGTVYNTNKDDDDSHEGMSLKVEDTKAEKSKAA